MTKVIEKFCEMPERELIDCRMTSFRDILLYNDIKVDSFSICIISSIINFIFGQIKLRDSSNVTFWLAGGCVLKIEDIFFSNTGIKSNLFYFGDEDETWSTIIRHIDSNTPLLVVLDSRYIVKNQPIKDFNIEYINIHNPSIAVVVGYDLKTKSVYLDLKESNSNKICIAKFSEFMDSIQSNSFPLSPGKKYYILDIGQEYKSKFESNKPLIIKNSLLNSCDFMLGSKSPDSFQDTRIIESNTGIKGLYRLCEVLEEFLENVECEEIDEKVLNKVFVYKFISLRESLLPGSNTCYRDEYAQGLINVADVLQNKKLKKVGKLYFKIGMKWRALVRLLYNSQFSINNKSKYINNVISSVRSIASDEENIFCEIKDAIS